jgi:GTP cyclohydrolase I
MKAMEKAIELTRTESTDQEFSVHTVDELVKRTDPIEQLFRDMIVQLGEDPGREGLLKTPARAARAMRFLCQGYQQDVEAVINGALFSSDATDMVVVRDIELYSLCEHHLLPFVGKAHIAYIPNGKVLGLSKLARVVDVFARRLQIQEQLTNQIARCIQKYTDAKGVGVVIEARHMCMMMRGVQKQNSSMTTSCVLGEMHDDPATRAEFFSLVRR